MGKIKIKEENKGKFTAWARSHGMSVQQAANRILRNREKYSPALIKRANFARNAAKWEGGGQFSMGGAMGLMSMVPQLIQAFDKPRVDRLAMEEANTQKQLGLADAGQAGILNNYPAVFKTGGMFKGKKFGGKPNAEVEKGEMIMTPDGVMTKMMGKSHAQGGMPVQLPTDSLIISKGNSKDILPLASKINKQKEIMEGSASKLTKNSAEKNLNKYYSKVLDRYNKQEAKKFAKGGQYKFGGGGKKYESVGYNPNPGGYTNTDWSWQNGIQGFGNDPYATDFNLPEMNKGKDSWYSPMAKANFSTTGGVAPVASGDPRQADINRFEGFGHTVNPITWNQTPQVGTDPTGNTLVGTNNPIGNGAKPPAGTDWVDLMGSIGEMAPMLYNLGQGLFGKREKTARNAYDNPNEGQINSLMANRRYNIDAGLAGNETSYRTASANMRNLGGSRGQVMSNLTGAQNTKQFGDMALYGQKNNIENQYRGEQANMLYGLGRDKSMSRMAIDEGNQMTDASGRNMIGAGMTGLQQYLLTRRQMKGQAKRDDMLMNLAKAYSPYARKWMGIQ